VDIVFGYDKPTNACDNGDKTTNNQPLRRRREEETVMTKIVCYDHLCIFVSRFTSIFAPFVVVLCTSTSTVVQGTSTTCTIVLRSTIVLDDYLYTGYWNRIILIPNPHPNSYYFLD
jgi:hypothetical protein